MAVVDTVDSRAASSTLLAKAALRRLAQTGQEPTPENYARAWALEAGTTPPPAAASAPGKAAPAAGEPRAQGQAWAALIERLAANLERSGRQWTAARRKDSLQRVLQGSRNDAERLLQRLQSLVQAWQADKPADAPELADLLDPDRAAARTGTAAPGESGDGDPAAAAPAASAASAASTESDVREPQSRRAIASLAGTLDCALPASDARAAGLASRLAALAERVASVGADAALAVELDQVCLEAQRWFGHHHQLVDQLTGLCRELTQGLTELAEDDSWTRGQCAGLEARLGEELSVRALRAATDTLRDTRRHQQRLRGERAAARDSLKQLLAHMLNEVNEIGQHTGVFEHAVQRHAAAIAQADSVEGLAGVVQAMLDDSRAVRSGVGASQARLHEQQTRAADLEQRVRALEAELRRISDEAATDALTQVANRRGLEQSFAAEAARCERASAGSLAIGLIDIDNFKKLNDRLGHAAGDEALRALATAIRERLRPVDHIARFGGEEFVLLMPDTWLDAAEKALTRLQRSLSVSLFMHEGEDVFVTFSAGVTVWRTGETLEATLARADEALYEAKRTGKNRTCKA